MRKLRALHVSKQFEVENKYRYFVGASGFFVRAYGSCIDFRLVVVGKPQRKIGAEGAYHCASGRFYCGYAACSNSRFGFKSIENESRKLKARSRKLKRFSVGKQFEVENKHRYSTNKLQNGIGAEGAYRYFSFGFRGASGRFYCGYAACSNSRFGF